MNDALIICEVSKKPGRQLPYQNFNDIEECSMRAGTVLHIHTNRVSMTQDTLLQKSVCKLEPCAIPRPRAAAHAVELRAEVRLSSSTRPHSQGSHMGSGWDPSSAS